MYFLKLIKSLLVIYHVSIDKIYKKAQLTLKVLTQPWHSLFKLRKITSFV